MTCPQCNAENPAGFKFCNACGSALQSPCSRCGNIMHVSDRFCSSCGQSRISEETSNTAAIVPKVTNQYTSSEIEELLTIRKMMRREDTASKTLNQDDVDKLFG